LRLLDCEADQKSKRQEQDGEVIDAQLLQFGFHGGLPWWPGSCLTNYQQSVCHIFILLICKGIIYSEPLRADLPTALSALEIDTCPDSRRFGGKGRAALALNRESRYACPSASTTSL
jgi:hypothetical protein